LSRALAGPRERLLAPDANALLLQQDLRRDRKPQG
jgi:hypothetical protein